MLTCEVGSWWGGQLHVMTATATTTERTAATIPFDVVAAVNEVAVDVEFEEVAGFVASFVGELLSPSFGSGDAAFLNAFAFFPLHTGCATEHARVSTVSTHTGRLAKRAKSLCSSLQTSVNSANTPVGIAGRSVVMLPGHDRIFERVTA